MIVFHALLALFSAVFFLGLLWPHRMKHAASAAFSGYFAKAMWITWIIVVSTYFLSIGTWIRYILYVVAVVLVIFPILRRKNFALSIPKANYYKKSNLFFIALILGGIVIILIALIRDYDLIFTKWDAVVQNNRWAIELVSRSYWHHTAYPIFIPGVWSFIYNLQGTTEVWIFAKLFAPLVVIMMLIYGLLLFSEDRKMMSLVVIGSLALFALTLKDTIADGYADAPVTLFIFFGYLLVFDALREDANSIFKEKFMFALLLLGLAATVKQVGVLSLIPVLCLLAYFLWSRKITIKQFILWGVTLSTPLILFLLIFQFQFQDKEHFIFGNISNLSLRTANNLVGNTFMTAANRLFNYFHPLLVIIAALLSLLSFKIRNPTYKVIGITSLICVPFGFVFYAQCCSYEARNGFWLMGLLLLAAISFLIDHFDNRLYREPNYEPTLSPKKLMGILFVLAFSSVLLAVVFSPRTISNTLSSDGLLSLETVSEINVLRAIVFSGGIICFLLGVLILFAPRCPTQVSRWVNNLFHNTSSDQSELKISGWIVSSASALMLLIIPIISAIALPDSKTILLQETYQAKIGSPWGLGIILENLDKLGDTGLILSQNQPLAFNLAIRGRFALCSFKLDGSQKCTFWKDPGNSAAYEVLCGGNTCVDTIIQKYPSSMFLVRNANEDNVINAFSESDEIEIVKIGGGDYILYWFAPIEKH